MVCKVIDKELKGKIGDDDSEIIRHIVVMHLAEKGYLIQGQGARGEGLSVSIEDIASQLDIHDAQIEALVEILEEKGDLNIDHWSRLIKKKMHKG